LRSRPIYYGWTIVVVAFLSLGTWLAMRTTFSLFLIALLDEFHWSRAAAAGVQSVSFIVYMCSAPLVGSLIDRFGPRRVIPPGIVVLCAGLFLSSRVHTLAQFYLFYGVIAGFGVTFVSISPFSAVLSRWFQKKRGLASGIAVSGMGVGTFVFVPLTQYVIGGAGWRSAFMVLSGCIFLFLLPLSALLLRRSPQDMGLAVDGAEGIAERKRGIEIVDRVWAETDWTLKRAAREVRFWSLLLFSLLIIFPVYLVVIHGAKVLADSGLGKMDVAFMIAVVGITSSAFQVFWGWLSDRVGREVTVSLGATALMLAIFLLLLVEAGARPVADVPLRLLLRLWVGCHRPHVHGDGGRSFSGKIVRPDLWHYRGGDRCRLCARAMAGRSYLRCDRQLSHSLSRRNRVVRCILSVCLGCGAQEGAPPPKGLILTAVPFSARPG
jgi:MFS family permease